jgi:sigma-B regulation protein RsbU (phosphoserine phosphatase)
MIDDKHMCFLIADVSGKSVPGAMFMMMSKTHIKNYASLGMPLDEVVYRVNERLCENNMANMFVTLFVCTLDLETGIVSYVDAGHNLPYISKAGGEFKMLSCEANLVVGMMEDMPYNLQTLELKKGDRIFFYTDGVTEAMNKKDEFYTERRLEEALNSIDKNLSPEEFLEENYRRVEEFTEGAEQSDDITMLYLAR